MCPDDDQKQKDDDYQDDELRKYLESNLKYDVNNFLYDKVPHFTTIREFEKLSEAIHNTIMCLWE